MPEGAAHRHRAVLRGPGGVGEVLRHLSPGQGQPGRRQHRYFSKLVSSRCQLLWPGFVGCLTFCLLEIVLALLEEQTRDFQRQYSSAEHFKCSYRSF